MSARNRGFVPVNPSAASKASLATAMLGAAALTLGALAPAPASALEKVTVGHASPITAVHSHYFFGTKLGYFADEGLEVEPVPLQGSGVMVPQVVNKQLTFGLPNPDLAIIALDKGEPLPVRFVYNHLRSQTFEFVVLEDSEIQEIADLKGKKLGVGAMSWGNLPMSRAMLADYGIVWQEDVEVLPIGLGPAAWKRLEGGEVDAINLFATEHERLAISGVPIRRLEMPEKFARIFSNGFIAHEDTIRDNPELVERYLRALAKSATACEANRRECARSMWEFYPAQRPTPDQEETWLDNAERVLTVEHEVSWKLQPGQPDQWGYYRAEVWQDLIDVMHGAGVISSADLPLDQLYTNEFIEKANDFDRDAVVAEAKAVN